MQDRIKMNTESLQKEFPDVYQDFFVNHDLVVSGCFTLPWTPYLFGESEVVMSIKQNLPTRCYVGFTYRKDNQVKINDLLVYDISNNIYNIEKFAKINQREKELIEFFELEKEKININKGLNISILTENSRGHGVSFSGTMASAIATGFFILSGQLSILDIKKNSEFSELEIFKNIHLLARKISFISRFSKSVGINPFFSLHNSSNPTFFLNKTENGDTVNSINGDSVRFFDIFKKFNSNYTEIPVDYALIFTGKKSKTQQVEHYRDLDFLSGDKMIDFIYEKTKFIDTKDLNYKKFIDKGKFTNWYNNKVSYLVNRLLYLFYQFLNEGYNELVIDKLINHFNLYRNIFSLLEQQNSFADMFAYKFEEIKSNMNEIIGITPTYSGKLGGSCIIFMKEGYSRETFLKTFEELKNNYPNCELEYASWLDGNSSEGVRLEQFISEEIFSKHFDKNKLILQTNKGERILGEQGELMKKMGEGILVDTINRKIFVNGKKLTSKDIPSQVTTVEVLSILLANEGKEVTNNIFEVSSYSKNKNDMIGKIVIPLEKLTKKYFGKKIGLICKGSLIEFQMSLKEKDINIGIIKKI